MEREAIRILEGVYGSRYGIRKELAAMDGYRELTENGYLEMYEDEEVNSLRLTDKGMETLRHECTGVPIEVREVLFTYLPKLPPLLRFDLATPEGCAAADAWIARGGAYKIRYIREAGMDRPALVLNGDERSGLQSVYMLFPEGTNLAGMLVYPQVSAIAGEHSFVSIMPLNETWRILDGFRPDTSSEAMEREHADLSAGAAVKCRSLWNLFLGEDNTLESMRDALRYPELSIYRDVCETEPFEVCVRATGDVDGRYWSSMNLMLLSPEWDDNVHEANLLADAIAENWAELCEAYRISQEIVSNKLTF